MSNWNLPPGVSTYDVDQAFGSPEELCDHGLPLDLACWDCAIPKVEVRLSQPCQYTNCNHCDGHGLFGGGPCPCKCHNRTIPDEECPRCHSADTSSIAGDFPTGVVAPDGGREIQYEEGFQCMDCGLCFEGEGRI